jgi:hypothetical protein
MVMFLKNGDKVGEQTGYNYDPKAIERILLSLLPAEEIPSVSVVPDKEKLNKPAEETKSMSLALEQKPPPPQGGGNGIESGPCSVCQMEKVASGLLSQLQHYPIVNLHNVDVYKILENASRCQHCRFVIQTCCLDPNFPMDVVAGDGNMDVVGFRTMGLSRLDVSVWFKTRFQGRVFKSRILQMPPVSESSAGPDYFSGRIVADNSDFKLYRTWLGLCETCHTTSCKEERWGASKLEVLRLIDVETRSVIANVPSEARYVALSYVWGKAQQLLLTQETFTRLTSARGLSEDRPDIPKTVLDAMNVTSELGFRYLWIDTLCIKQDDPKDKDLQISNMDRIYSCASLTIVSTGPNADSGIPGLGESSRSSRQVTRIFSNVQLVSALPILSQALLNSPWDQRGWTLQEKALSKRLLIFTEFQAFWHCNNGIYSEDTTLESAKGIVNMRHNTQDYESYSPTTLRIYKPSPQDSAEVQYVSYLRSYISRDLSYPGDAINAFTGLLKVFTPRLGPSVWGIPTGIFESALAWKTTAHFPRRRNSEFPSWSWAGWFGGKDVDTERFSNDPIVKIRWWRIEQDGSNISDRNFALIETRGANQPYSEFTTEFFGVNSPSPPPHPDDISQHASILPPTKPPLSHLLFFWTSAVAVSISREPTEPRGKFSEYNIHVAGRKNRICTAVLDYDWRQQKSEENFEIIFLAQAWDKRRFKFDQFVWPLLIEWEDGIAYRVQSLSSIRLPHWESCEPKFKFITLA